MKLADFQFDLPKELIAKYPSTIRSGSRLLALLDNKLEHRLFADLLDYLNAGDLLVFNDTRVISARLFGRKTTGGQVEILVERVLDDKRILAQVRVSKPPRIGEQLLFGNNTLNVLGRQKQFYELGYEGVGTILAMIEAIGEIPLPPYMERKPDAEDLKRYQTIYAREDGSVAAPTAGLHFDETMFAKLKAKQIEFGFLTLHVGAGTFSPVRVENIKEHEMHAEYFEVSEQLVSQIKAAHARGNRVITVGTTSLRALESASSSGVVVPFAGETNIFIYPGYQFKTVDALVTNFHLPGSTLLMLVAAFGGHENVMRAYREAVASGYRFYSYGDAMFMARNK